MLVTLMLPFSKNVWVFKRKLKKKNLYIAKFEIVLLIVHKMLHPFIRLLQWPAVLPILTLILFSFQSLPDRSITLGSSKFSIHILSLPYSLACL